MPEQQLRDIAKHYDLDLERFTEWHRAVGEPLLLGSISSPSIQNWVNRYRRWGDGA